MTFLVFALPGVPAAAAPPPYTMEERAAAIASPALVYIEARTVGYLRSKATGELLDEKSFTMVLRCSGFAVHAAGYVITTENCVQPSRGTLHGWAARWFADRLISGGQLVKDQKNAYADALIDTSELTDEGRAFPLTKVYGQVFQAWGGLTASPAFAGQIAESDASNNAALIKFDYENMSAAQIGSDQLEIGRPVVLVGFGTTDTSAQTAAFTVRSRSVRVTSDVEDKTPPRHLMDGEIGDYSHGGMVVDASGRVIGVIEDDPTTSPRANRAAGSMAPFQELLKAAGVSNTLSPRDQAYRAGLDAYFAGRYAEAIERLDTVIAAVPDHTVASEYRRNASERLAVEGGATGSRTPWALIVIIVLAIMIVALLVMLIVVLLRRRTEEVPVSALPYNWPISAIPISATPVSGHGYEDHSAAPHQTTWQQPTFSDPLALPSYPAPSGPGSPVSEPGGDDAAGRGATRTGGTDSAPS